MLNRSSNIGHDGHDVRHQLCAGLFDLRSESTVCEVSLGETGLHYEFSAVDSKQS